MHVQRRAIVLIYSFNCLHSTSNYWAHPSFQQNVPSTTRQNTLSRENTLSHVVACGVPGVPSDTKKGEGHPLSDDIRVIAFVARVETPATLTVRPSGCLAGR